MTIHLSLENCKSCSLCLDICPNDLIKYTDEYNSNTYRVIEVNNKEFCLGQKCNKCVEICPDQVFSLDLKEEDLSSFFYLLGRKYSKIINKIKK